MKHLTTKISALLMFFGIICSHQAESQSFENILAAGQADANTYLQNYTEPMMLSFNNGLASGWYNTAKPHKLLGFDLTMTVNVANVPSGDRKFRFNPDDYEVLELASGPTNTAVLPSAVGGPTDEILRVPGGTTIAGITYDNPQDFDAPDGFDAEGLPIVGFPVPALQLGVGLPKGTELKVRYASDFGALGDDGSFNLIGFGILHDVKQWIPGLKQIPFDLSGFVSYTSLTAEFPIDAQTDDGSFNGNGDAEIKATSLTFQGVISKKLSIFTPYVGVGYNIGSSSLKVNGEYTYSSTTGSSTINDPIDLSFSGGSSPRINAGLRIKLLILTLHAEYAIQKYNTFTAGVGISIR